MVNSAGMEKLTVWEEQERDNCRKYSRDPLEDEEPAPASKSTQPVHETNGVGEESTDGSGEHAARIEEPDPQWQLVWRIPEGQVVSAGVRLPFKPLT